LKSSFFKDYNFDIGGFLTVGKYSKVLIKNITLINIFSTLDGGSINIDLLNKIIIKNI
jgi:hypothetical protein